MPTAVTFLILSAIYSAADINAQHMPSPKVTIIKMSTEEGYRIYEHWTTQAFASMLSLFLQEKYSTNQLVDVVPDQFKECYFRAQTVPLMSKCIVRLLDKEFETGLNNANKNVLVGSRHGANEMAKNARRISNTEAGSDSIKKDHYDDAIMPKYESLKVRKREAIFAKDEQKFDADMSTQNRRNIVISKKQSYNLLEAKRTFGLSPVGGVARLLMSGVLERRNKTRAIPWQESIAKIREAKKMDNQLRRKDEKKWRDYAMKRLPTKSTDLHKKYLKNPLRLNSVANGMGYTNKVNKLERQIAKLVNDGIKVGMRLANSQRKSNATDATKSDEEFEEDEEEEENKNDEMEEEEDEQQYDKKISGIRGGGGGQRGVGSGGQKGVEDDGGRLMDILSPRFMSVTARKSKGKANFLSPSLFSLHNKGHGLERKLSLPNLMKDGAQSIGRDQNEWLNLIMEASGVNEQADNLKKYLSIDEYQQKDDVAEKIEKRYKRDFDGLYLTKENISDLFGRNEQRKSDIWEKLVQNFTTDQWKEMNRTGVVPMNVEQLHLIYGPDSPFNDSEALKRLMPIVNNGSSLLKLIECDIKRLSEMHSFDIRKHDVDRQSAYSLSACLLSNHSVSDNNGVLNILKIFKNLPPTFWPAILSPRFFSPPILSPRIMTPLVLSPFIFSSIILTPIIMQPFILTPGFLNSIILSPFIMNPQIMSSHFFHPAILSPLLLTPAILNPSMMSPIVLSPLVLTPQIFSPKLLSGLFLSPYALSPVLMSPVFSYLVILSPSWLS